MTVRTRPIFTLLAGLALVSCSDDHINVGTGGGGASSGTQSTSASMSTGGNTGSSMSTSSMMPTSSGTSTSSGIIPPDHLTECQGKVYACGDLVDNDMDGLVDSVDPDCLGPCDNTEDSYFGGIPGQTGPGCTQDCYFDQDSGAGNDGCYWSHACDPHEVPPDYYPESQNGASCAYSEDANIPGTSSSCAELDVAQSQACHDYCGPLTPNGCDCFGCCELPAAGGNYVWLGSEGAGGHCDIAHLADPSICQPCKPVAACLNDCDPCEICIGKPLPDPGCGGSTSSTTSSTGAFMTSSTGSGGSQCLPGVQECGLAGQAPCPVDYFCNTGCCTEVPK